MAKGVGQAASKGKERSEREQVSIDRPLDSSAGEAQFPLDLGDRDGNDRLVDEGHGHGKNHRCQDQIPAAVSPTGGYHGGSAPLVL